MHRKSPHRRRTAILGAAIGLAVGPASLKGATTAHWLNAVTGHWDDSAMWSSSPFRPQNNSPAGVTYDVVINAVGSAYTVNSGGGWTIDSLLIDSPDATVRLAGTEARVINGLTLNAGTLEFLEGAGVGSYSTFFGSIAGSGGMLNASHGVFDGVNLAHDLTVQGQAGLVIRNGLTMTDATITPGTPGVGASVVWSGTQLISGTGQFIFAPGTYQGLIASSGGGTITVASDISVRTSNSSGMVETELAEIVNYGRFVADGGSLTITSPSSIPLPDRKPFTNKGVLEATNGGVLALTGVWNNADGIIRVTGAGSVVLGAAYVSAPVMKTADLGLMETAAGTVELRGVLDNTAATLALTPTTGSLHLGGGKILNGTVTASGADVMLRAMPSGGELDGITLAAPLLLPQNTTLQIRDGLTLDNGLVTFQGGAGTWLNFQGSQTVGGTGEIVFDGPSSNNNLRPFGGSAITFAGGITIRTGTAGGSVGIDTEPLHNAGTISARTAGQILYVNASALNNAGTLEGRDGGLLILRNLQNAGVVSAQAGGTVNLQGTWSNAGTMNIDGGTLILNGSFARGDLGTINRTGGTLRIDGIMDNTGGVFDLGAYGGDVELAGTGKITGGTVAGSAGAKLVALNTPTLDNVALAADMDLWNARVTSNALMLDNATIAITRTTGNPGLIVGATLGGTGEVVFQSGTNIVVTPLDASGLIVGSEIMIRSDAGSGTVGNAFIATTNHGVISARNGRSITVTGSPLTNHGVLEAQTGSTLVLGGSWSNLGQLLVNDGTVNLGGSFATAGIGTFVRTGGRVVLSGVLDNTGASLDLVALGGSWELQGSGRINAGTVMGSSEAQLLIQTNASGTLDAVVLAAPLSITSGTANILNGVTLSPANPVTLVSVPGGISKLSFSGAQTIGGNGEVRFAGVSTNNNIVASSSGTLTIGSGITIRTDTTGGTIGSTSAGTINQGLISAQTAGQTITLAGPFTNSGTLEAIGGGSIISSGTLTSSGSIEVDETSSLTVSGALNLSGGSVGGAGRIVALAGATVSNTVTKPGPGVLDVRGAGLVINASATLDLTEGKLIVRNGDLGAWNGSAYTGLSGLIDAGRGDAGDAQWDGVGIVTSDTRAIGTGNLASLGIARAGDVGKTTFAGQSVAAGDVIAMLTYGGDANLDGKINIDDYGRIDGTVSQSGSVFGWSNGDFNYDGKINIDDYGIIDGNINRQGAPFATALPAALSGVAAVPEPAGAMTCLAAGALLLRRRGRAGSTPAVPSR